MSGVTGNNKIQSRKDFREILKTAKSIMQGFPGFVSVQPTGSYNSDKKKTTFGDIDLITHIDGSLYNNDKKKIKSALAKYMTSQSDKIVVPFVSDKYAGKRYYNSGEIITISLNIENPSIQACQVDYMIAMDATETKFKKDFLDMPAAKQGIVLGLVKTALIEQTPNVVFKRLGIKENTNNIDKKIQEYEFNLSSTEIQLRLVTYVEPGSFKQKSREIVWRSRDFDNLQEILTNFDLGLSFDKLITQAKKILKKTRSTQRMAGVFRSMISIKSGEVGKQKGKDKQEALDKVQKLFGESTQNIKFADFINEMAKEQGISDKRSKEHDWDLFYKKDIGTNKVKLVNDKLSKNKLKVYRTLNIFFLASTDDDYLGHIEFSKNKNVITINESNSKILRGFYSLMFNVILSEDDITEILSDNKLSTQAIKSYIRINDSLANQLFSIKVKQLDGSYIELNDKNIRISGNIVSVKEKDEGYIKESWEEFNKRYNTIDEAGTRSSWGNAYEISRRDIDMTMFLTEIFL